MNIAQHERRGRRYGRRQLLQARIASGWRRFRRAWQAFAESRLAVLGLVLIVVFGVMAFAHPVLRATVWKKGIYNPKVGFDATIMHPSLPSARHLLGTDALGRDVLSMLLAAATPEFILGLTAAVTAAVVGTAIGAVSAYYHGKATDTILSHLADTFLLLPPPLFMVIVAVRFISRIGPVEFGLIYGLLAGLSSVAIVMRSYAMTVLTRPFIEACRVAGGGGATIIWVHLIPHMLPMAALYMMLTVTGAVIADGFVSFFGLTRTYLNWGSIVYNSFASARMLGTGTEWHTLIPPSLALSLFAAAFYLISRGLHEVADPRLLKR